MKNKKPNCKKPRTSGVRPSKRYANKYVFKKNNVAVVIPVAPDHFNYIEDIENATRGHIDVYWVFSTMEDLSEFNKVYRLPIKSIVFKVEIGSHVLYEYSQKNIVTSKKWIGLYTLWVKRKCTYDFIGVFDAEIKIIKPDIIASSIKKIGLQKNFLASSGNNMASKFIEKCKSFLINRINLTNKDRKIDLNSLRKYGDTNYTWFNNIPVYSRKDTLDFFIDIGFRYPFSDFFSNSSLNWHVFDHLVYAIWCVNKKNYNLIIIPVDFSLECASGKDFKKACDIAGSEIFWISRRTAIQIDPKDKCMSNVCIEYHQNR